MQNIYCLVTIKLTNQNLAKFYQIVDSEDLKIISKNIYDSGSVAPLNDKWFMEVITQCTNKEQVETLKIFFDVKPINY